MLCFIKEHVLTYGWDQAPGASEISSNQTPASGTQQKPVSVVRRMIVQENGRRNAVAGLSEIPRSVL